MESTGPKKGTTSGDVSFNEKPVYPNQQYAGLSTGTMTDAGGGGSDGVDGKAKKGATPDHSGPDEVMLRSSKKNTDGGHTDSSTRMSGSIDTTTFDKSGQAIKNRTDNPDKSFSEQTLDPKDHSVKVREQKANGDFSETNLTQDGKVTSKSHVTNPDGGFTDTSVGADGKTETTTRNKAGLVTDRKSENADHSYTERKLNPDNSTTFHDQKKDGSYVETLTDKNGTSTTVHTVNDIKDGGGSTTETTDPSGNVVRDRVTRADGSYFETTKNKDGTTTQHDQKKNLEYSETTVNDKGERVGPVVEVKGASEDFAEKVKADIAQLPASTKKLLADSGAKFLIAGTLVGAMPELEGKRPPGHPVGSTYADIEGSYFPEKRTAVVAEYTSSGPSNRDAGAVRHEGGHAVDHALDYPSNSPEFKAAYDKDVAAMSPETKLREQYLVQAKGGRSEAFAETFAAINGGPANQSQMDQIMQTYPNTIDYVRKRMNEVPQ